MYKKTFIVLFILLNSCTNTSTENFEDLKKIKIEMHVNTVKNTMRHKPVKVETAIWDNTKEIYYYQSPAAASDYYKIIIDKRDSLVTEINFGD